MNRHDAIVAVVLAVWVCFAPYPLIVRAHRHLLQQADVGADTAMVAVDPLNKVFSAEDFAPTDPEAAAAFPLTEVTVVYGSPAPQSASAPIEVSAAEAEAIAAMVAAAGPSVRCGTPVFNRTQKLARERKAKAIGRARAAAGIAVTAAAPAIGTWVHIINSGSAASQGNIPDSWVTSQISVLNSAYAGQFTFTLLGTTRTTNAAWMNMAVGTTAERQMKTTLRRGTAATLNLYTTTLANSVLGWSTYPGGELVIDGVMLAFSTLPGSTAAPYNLGDSAVHEVGHWLNLYHTFDGGCSPGDLVADTAPEATPAYGCPVGRDTCPSDTLPDPVRNFMDYTDDSCMNAFTAGQFSRMLSAWNTYRSQVVTPAVTSPSPPPTPPPSSAPPSTPTTVRLSITNKATVNTATATFTCSAQVVVTDTNGARVANVAVTSMWGSLSSVSGYPYTITVATGASGTALGVATFTTNTQLPTTGLGCTFNVYRVYNGPSNGVVLDPATSRTGPTAFAY